MDVDRMLARLERLEIQQRWFKRLGLAALLLLVLAAVGAKSPVDAVVEAEKFILRDEKGQARAMISVAGGRAALAFLRDGSPRLVLADGDEFLGLTLNNQQGQARLTLGAVGEHSAIVLNDKDGRMRAVLAVGKDGKPVFELLEEE